MRAGAARCESAANPRFGRGADGLGVPFAAAARFHEISKLLPEERARALGLLDEVELVRVDAKRHSRVRVSELAAEEDDVRPLRDQERGEVVAQLVPAELLPRAVVQPGIIRRAIEPALRDVAAAEGARRRVMPR